VAKLKDKLESCKAAGDGFIHVTGANPFPAARHVRRQQVPGALACASMGAII